MSFKLSYVVHVTLVITGGHAGSASVPCALRSKAPARTASVPLGAKPQSSPAARAAALNPQALPYVPPGKPAVPLCVCVCVCPPAFLPVPLSVVLQSSPALLEPLDLIPRSTDLFARNPDLIARMPCQAHNDQSAGGGSPSIQDAMAHAEAALHQLKEVIEKESWHKQGIQAAVQRKEAELQVKLVQSMSSASLLDIQRRVSHKTACLLA